MNSHTYCPQSQLTSRTIYYISSRLIIIRVTGYNFSKIKVGSIVAEFARVYLGQGSALASNPTQRFEYTRIVEEIPRMEERCSAEVKPFAVTARMERVLLNGVAREASLSLSFSRILLPSSSLETRPIQFDRNTFQFSSKS